MTGRGDGLAKPGAAGQSRTMITRAVLCVLAFLGGCATAAPEPDARAGLEAAPAPTAEPARSAGPSDWAVAIVGTPFVFAFRTVVCAATAVMAGPTAGLLALSDDPGPGLAYVRDGLAQNCGPPYGVPVPVADRYDVEPDVLYAPEPDVPDALEPDVGEPRPLTPYGGAAVPSP